MPDSLNPPPAAAVNGPLAPVFAALREQGGLPSAGTVLTKLTQLLQRDTEAVQQLAEVILGDLSLTQRLLHIANTLPFRAGPVPVTTVTRAIMLLGFNRVRATAVTLVLLDGVVGAANVARVRADFHQALLAGSLASELLAGEEAEEACIAAMFRNVGRLLVAVHAPAALDVVHADMAAEGLSEAAAVRRALGCSFDDLTVQVLREWRVPDRLVAAVQPMLRVEAAHSSAERIRAAAQFADATAAAMCTRTGAALATALAAVRERFTPALPVTQEQLAAAIDTSAAHVREFEVATGIVLAAPVVEDEESKTEGELVAEEVVPSTERDAVGRPANARDLLLAGLADTTDLMSRGADLNSVIRVALETLFSGLGFARAALVLREPASGLLRARMTLGEPRPAFGFRADGTADLFSAALTRGVDLHIANTATEKIRSRLPAWYARDFAAARSFLLMPLAIRERTVGFFYADRLCTDDAGLAGDELSVLRSLRGQVVLAMRSR